MINLILFNFNVIINTPQKCTYPHILAWRIWRNWRNWRILFIILLYYIIIYYYFYIKDGVLIFRLILAFFKTVLIPIFWHGEIGEIGKIGKIVKRR